jgi:hypothetical protein
MSNWIDWTKDDGSMSMAAINELPVSEGTAFLSGGDGSIMLMHFVKGRNDPVAVTWLKPDEAREYAEAVLASVADAKKAVE